MKAVHLIIAGLAFFLVSATTLASSEFRVRLNSQLEASNEYTADDIEAEIHFGRELASKVLGRYPLWDQPQANAYLNKVGQVLVQNSQRPELAYRFIALDTDTENAFAAPGGYVFITRGLLNQIKNEAELAAVLAHEIGHIEHRHYVKAVGLRGTNASLEGTLTRTLMGGGAAAVTAFDQAVNQMMEIFFETGLQSHEDELEADRAAVWLLTLAGYDPTAINTLFQRMADNREGEDAVSRTHPSFEDRILALEAYISDNQLDQLQLATLEERLHENLK